jgi:Xaa-Pro aminopeptidase
VSEILSNTKYIENVENCGLVDVVLFDPYNNTMFAPEKYRQRRMAFIRALHSRGIFHGTFILLGNREAPRNYGANCYQFRQDSSWLYLVGLSFPNLALSIDIEHSDTCFYAETPGIDEIIWTGARILPEDLAALSGIEKTAPFSALSSLCQHCRDVHEKIYILPPYRADQVMQFGELLEVASPSRSGALEEYIDQNLILSLIELREIKDVDEIAEIEHAVAVTASMHQDVLQSFRQGWTEKQAADFVLSRASSQGCELSFATIATCRGEVLHNAPTEYVASKRDSLLLDAGAEMPSGYAGDLTTTFPVGPRFDARARSIYELLLKVFEVATSSLKPGIRFMEVHTRASLAIAEGLISLGIMRGNPIEAVQAGAHALFFPHGLGHQIGLDVHDMESLGEDYVGYGEDLRRSPQFGLRSLRLAKTLKPGMVHSVEPGIYFIPQLIEKWRSEGICNEFIDYAILDTWMSVHGMRIEEDWCITEQAARRLGPAFDKKVDVIESVRRVL